MIFDHICHSQSYGHTYKPVSDYWIQLQLAKLTNLESVAQLKFISPVII